MMKKQVMAPLLALAFMLPVVGFAQSATQMQLAREVVALQSGPEQHSLLSKMADSAANVMVEKWEARTFGEVRDAKIDEVTKKLDAELNQLRAEVLAALKDASVKVENEELATFYATNFSEDELKALIAWFSSPAFKKYQDMAPGIATTYMNAVMERTYSKVQDLQGAFDDRAHTIIQSGK